MSACRIVVTTGEPAGIGPDLALAAALRGWSCELVFAGDPSLLAARASTLSLKITISEWTGETAPVPHRAGTMPVLSLPLARQVVAGRPDPANARYVLDLLDAAMDGCMAGHFAAMVTGPEQKSTINEARIAFTGHTEDLAARCHAPLRLKGRGIPAKTPGDLYVVLQVVLPPAESARQRRAWEQMQQEFACNPRAGLEV